MNDIRLRTIAACALPDCGAPSPINAPAPSPIVLAPPLTTTTTTVTVGAVVGELPVAANVQDAATKLGPAFERCYNRALKTGDSSQLKGGVTLVLELSQTGEPISVRAEQAAGVSDALVACVISRAKSAMFPASAAHLIRIPIRFSVAN